MPKKSFVEQEIAREARSQSGLEIPSRLDKLREACKRCHITPAQKDAAKKISAAIAGSRLGITPYHDDFELCYPTLSDSPQSIEERKKQSFTNMYRYIALSMDESYKKENKK